MRCGWHPRYQAGRPLWRLSGGQAVAPRHRHLVTGRCVRRPAGDALFTDMPGQVEDAMTDKPDLKLIEAAASDDPFDLSRLRINPEMLETTGVKKLLTTVPVRNRSLRNLSASGRPQYRETLAFIELKEIAKPTS